MASRSILVLNTLKNSPSHMLLSRSLSRLGYMNGAAVNKFASTRALAAALNGDKRVARADNNVLLNQRASIHMSRVLRNDVVTIESPTFAESIKEGDITFDKKVGESVAEDEIIAKIETDKTTIEIKAPKAGVIEELLVADGSAITANLPIIKLRTAGSGAAASAAAPAAASKPAEAPKQEEKAAAPAAAAQAAAAPPTSMPEPPKVPQKPSASVPLAQIPVTAFRPLETSGGGEPMNINKISGTRNETRVKMSKMRQTVASRLKTAQNTCAMLTTFNEINMGNLAELRKTYGEQFHKKHNVKLGFMSAFIKSAAYALQDQPIINAVIENNEIVYRDYVDISVAVATPKGLVVPVLRNIERMNYAEIEKEIAALGEKARLNKLAIEDMQGGTFTISNGGVFGSLFGTPIINLPQSAILGMHGIFDRPVAVNGQVVVKPMMYVALTYDHRLVDGREAVTFLRKIKSSIEDPRTLLLDI